MEFFQDHSLYNAWEGVEGQDLPSLGRLSKEESRPLSQGSSAQKQNLRSFAAVGLLGCLGFNAFANVFSKSSLISQGHFRLIKENLEKVASNFLWEGPSDSSPCFDVRDPNQFFDRDPKMSTKEIKEKCKKDFKNKPRVKLVLQSAPDSSGITDEDRQDPSIKKDLNRIEQCCIYDNFRRIFEAALEEAKEQAIEGMHDMGVHVHLADLGGEGFVDHHANIQIAFLRVLLDYRTLLEERHITISLNFCEGDAMEKMVKTFCLNTLSK